MRKGKGINYLYKREGKGLVKIEIRDATYKIIYRKKFNHDDKNAWWDFLQSSEKFGFSIIDLVKQKLRISVLEHI